MEISIGTANVGTVNSAETINGGVHIYNNRGDVNIYNYLRENSKEALSRIVEEADELSEEQVEAVAEMLQDSDSEELQARGGELMAVKDDREKVAGVLKLVGDALKNVNEGFKVGENIAKYGPILVALLQGIGWLAG